MNDFEKLKGKRVVGVSVREDRQVLTLLIKDEPSVSYRINGDCCSQSWIEEALIADWTEEVVLTGELEMVAELRAERVPGHDVLQVVVDRLVSEVGQGVVVRWCNSSNGYYSGFWSEELTR